MLTKQQEKFAVAIAGGLDFAASLRAAGIKVKPEEVNAKANELGTSPGVIERINELEKIERESLFGPDPEPPPAIIVQEEVVTVDELTKKLRRAYNLGIVKNQVGPAVNATMGLAKLHGLLVDRIEGDPSKPVVVAVLHKVVNIVRQETYPPEQGKVINGWDDTDS